MIEGSGGMNKRMQRRIWRLWSYLEAAAVIFFCMAAGAAVYHQHIVQSQRASWKVQAVTREQIKEPKAAGMETKEQEPEESTPIREEDRKAEEEMDELELLAICVEAEAGNQELKGKRLVTDVILNRVDDPDFPDSIEGVISQKFQFSSYWDGGMERVTEPSEETFLAVQMELEERGWPGVLYFTAEDWPKYGTPWKKVGDHYFSTK